MVPWRILLGAILVALGALFLLDQLGVVAAGRIIAGWWPLLIVAAGVLQLVNSREAPAGPIIVILVGLALLGWSLRILPGNVLALFWPLALILIGVWLLFSRVWGRGAAGAEHEIVDSFAVFSELGLENHSPRFRGGFLGALFGEVTLDLRRASLAPEGAALNSTMAFGDMTIRVPQDWRVEVGGVPILSDVDNKASGDGWAGDGAPVLKVQTVALLSDLKVTD